MARVILCDDHAFIMEGQMRILESMGHQVVGTATNGRDLIQCVQKSPVDLMITDIGMPSLNGLDALVRVLEIVPKMRCIVISMHEDAIWVARAFAAGAKAYLTKCSDITEFEMAVKAVLCGETYIAKKLSEGSLGISGAGLLWSCSSRCERKLTRREREVLQLIGEGKTHKEIGVELSISVATVRMHQENICRDYGVSTRAALVKYAIREGLTEL